MSNLACQSHSRLVVLLASLTFIQTQMYKICLCLYKGRTNSMYTFNFRWSLSPLLHLSRYCRRSRSPLWLALSLYTNTNTNFCVCIYIKREKIVYKIQMHIFSSYTLLIIQVQFFPAQFSFALLSFSLYTNIDYKIISFL